MHWHEPGTERISFHRWSRRFTTCSHRPCWCYSKLDRFTNRPSRLSPARCSPRKNRPNHRYGTSKWSQHRLHAGSLEYAINYFDWNAMWFLNTFLFFLCGRYAFCVLHSRETSVVRIRRVCWNRTHHFIPARGTFKFILTTHPTTEHSSIIFFLEMFPLTVTIKILFTIDMKCSTPNATIWSFYHRSWNAMRITVTCSGTRAW